MPKAKGSPSKSEHLEHLATTRIKKFSQVSPGHFGKRAAGLAQLGRFCRRLANESGIIK